MVSLIFDGELVYQRELNLSFEECEEIQCEEKNLVENNTGTQCNDMKICPQFVNDKRSPEFPKTAVEETWSWFRQQVWVALSTCDSSGNWSFCLGALHKIEETIILNTPGCTLTKMYEWCNGKGASLSALTLICEIRILLYCMFIANN